MDKAKMNWNEQLKKKGFTNSSITKEIFKAHEENNQQQRQAIGFLIDDIRETPDKFDNHFRNLYSYVQTKNQQVLEEENPQTRQKPVDYLKHQANERRKLKAIMKKH